MPDSEERPRKHWLLAILTVLFLSIGGFVVIKIITSGSEENNPALAQVETFSLNSEYYTDAPNVAISSEDFKNLISEKKSFVIYSALPQCTEDTAIFREFIEQFQKENRISFYKMSSEDFKTSSLSDTIKYLPTVVIFKDGEIVKYLDFNSDSDLPYYKTIEDFTKWFTTYVTLTPQK